MNIATVNLLQLKQFVMDEDVTIVNVVATGELDVSVNLEHLYEAADNSIIDYDPVNHQGLYFRFDKGSSLTTIYNSGKFIIRANSCSEVESQRQKLLKYLEKVGIPNKVNEVNFEINNIVAKASIGREIELKALAEDLELGKAEYFSSSHRLVYRISDSKCTIILFRTGQAMLMGARTFEGVDTTWKCFKTEIESLFESKN